MDYSFIVAVILVILVVAFIVWIAKKISAGERLDMKEGVVGVVILLVAVLVMVPMVSSTQVYTWDPDSGELTIQQNISGGVYAWDGYDDQIRSIVVKPGVTQIGNSAFDGATNLEYLSIPDTVTDIGANAFGVVLKDPYDQTLTAGAGVFAGYGDGTLYEYDRTILVHSNGAVHLNSAASGVKNVVIPESIDGTPVTSIAQTGFAESGIVRVIVMGDNLTTIAYRAFKNCTDLQTINLPDSVTTMAGESFSGSGIRSISAGRVTTLGNSVFNGCASLTSATFAAMPAEVLANVFKSCTSLESIEIPEGVTSISNDSFNGCTSLKSIDLPDSLTTINYGVFAGCTGIESVTFGTGLTSIQTNAFSSWTFYESDGVTTITKTAANLAGKTFQGTAAALVEVTPGLLSLTPQQLQQVHLHDAELQDLKDHLTIDPLPFQPSVQTEDPVAA